MMIRARAFARFLARRLVGYESPPGSLPTLSDVMRAPELADHVSIGRHTYGDPYVLNWPNPVRAWTGGDIQIGNFCSIAYDVHIFTGGEHRTDWTTTFPLRSVLGLDGAYGDGHPRTRGDVRIGHDVWLGAGSWVMSGVTIGDGAVVGAGAVVDRDVRPYAIVIGNRAREVRRRFDDLTVLRLQELRWWDWTDEEIAKRVGFLCSAPTLASIAELTK